jgi:hypothetical protein
MIGTTARVLVGLMIGAAMLIALTIALCTDLFAPETRPSLRGVRPKSGRAFRRSTLGSQAPRSLMEAGT